MSVGVPRRPTGIESRIFCVRGSCDGLAACHSGVSMLPGPMALEVNPSRASSSAQVFINPCSADFDAASLVGNSLPRAARDEMATVLHSPASRLADSLHKEVQTPARHVRF